MKPPASKALPSSTPESESGKQWKQIVSEAASAYACVGTWILISALVILFNKWILSVYGFHFPILLTMWHMLFCSVAAQILVRNLKVTEPIELSSEDYRKKIIPIAVLYAGTLCFSNAAYLTLSVAFIQMIKAMMPACVYLTSILFRVDKFSVSKCAIMTVVCVGTTIASFGELNFVLVGFLFQAASLATESTRIVLVQILLQRQGLKLNPLTTLYYLAPACLAFLCVPFCFFELPEILQSPPVLSPPLWLFTSTGDLSLPIIFLANAISALLLNLAVLLTIGRLSALTLNVGGVIKDWLLIALSAWIFAAPMSAMQLQGYGLAFLGVCMYNYIKYKERLVAMQLDQEQQAVLEEGKQGSSSK